MLYRLASLCLVAMTTIQPAMAGGYEIILGREMVEMYCRDCHAIGLGDESTFAPAPPFRTLHQRYDVELLSEALVEGLVTAHPEMPEFEFDPYQAEAIVQYLEALEPQSEAD